MIIERRGSTPRRSDSGFTLIELLMAIVLGGIIAGVTVAALATSMHIAKSTTDQVNDSNDAGLVAAFFFRDAQSAGATDPATATADPSLGVSVDDSAAGWGGCTQVGALVVRFSWVERRSSAAPHAVTVTYALDDINELTRRLCADGTSVDVVVGRSITAASVACQPDPSCTSRPTSATLTVTGSAAGVPLTSSLTASLRGDVQAAPQSANSSPVGLVALGVPVSSVPCPNLTLGGSGTLNVIGDVMVDARCGSVPISDPSGLLRPTGTTSTIAGIVDPFAGRTPPSGSCASAGANPVPIGSSSGPAAVIVYPQAVSISTAVEFEAGTHVFCAGLDIAAGASVTGSDILLYLADGSLVVDAATTVDLAASPTGAYAQLLIWIAAPETVVIAGGVRVGSFAGYVYAPSSTVQLSSELAANIGGIIAKDVIFSGPGEARIGLAMPDLVIGPTTGPRAQVGVAYTAQMSVSGGVAPWTWTATGLAPGLDIDPSTGDITGVPTAAGTFAAIITVFESTRAAASIDYTVSVAEPLLIGGPGALPMGQVGVVYAPTTAPTSGGTAPFTWSAVGLPPGLGIDSATGLISGSPTGAGSFDVTVTVTDAMSGTATLTDTIVVHPPLTISGPGSIPNGQAGVVYPATSVIAAGGTAPRTWSATGLPAGLTIGASTGTISGTPTSFGSFNAVVTVTDAMSGVATTDYVLAVSSPPMVSDPGAIPDGYVGSDFTPTSIAATGGTQPFAWSAVGLPSGMSIGAATGIMSGTPLVAGTFDVTVTVTDTLSATAQRAFQLTILPPAIALTVAGPDTIPAGRVATTYPTTTATAAGGVAPYAWTAAGLPPGLGISASSGAITGTPSAAGTYTVTVTVTDAVMATAQATYVVTIAPAVVVPPGCPATTAGWRGQYYANNSLSGASTLCRDDANIDFDWAYGSPATGLPADNFSVRWTRTQEFVAGSYVFTVGSDDGARLYIDGVLVLDRWIDQAYPTPQPSVTRSLTAGSHTVVMEYYERGGAARATLAWAAVPPPPPSCSVAANGWLGQYYNNGTLTGSPTMCRDDASVNFDWSNGAAAAGLPTDDFSVRWTRVQSFVAGTYTFRLGTDDGGRLYIDGVLVLERWVNQSYPTPQPSVVRTLSAGPHTLVVEYYERGGLARATLTWS